ncbi:MAG TPA: tRNA adenosine(34) deaminase TadA [Tepidisphaeraceae bacterium]|nr:tRNA adenosine(34) deaminase TadA [Tepidisphaeraceae bacterium]
MTDHETWMRLAIAQAHAARAIEEVPIGCIVVHNSTGRIIGCGHNRRQTDRDPTGHAEIFAIKQAAQELKDWRLNDCTLIVTLEPCPMCAGAIVNARISRLIYGCDDPKAGAVKSLYRLCEDTRLNHRLDIVSGVLAEDCAALLKDFFAVQRAMGKK